MKRNLFALAVLGAALGALAAIPEGYYDALEGKMKAELKSAAKSAARQHTVMEYGEDTWEAFKSTDVRYIGEYLCWWDMYSNINVKVSNGHPGMNIEHSVPNSWWGGVKNDAYKDIMHLNPSDATANNRKSNYPLGIVNVETWTNGVTTIGKPAAGECGGAPNVFEPADEYKGDFARTYFYVFTIYDDISWAVTQTDRNYMFDGEPYPSLRPWAYEMLLDWAKNDPVDNKELYRNEMIYGIQHNRNPFIDFPELAEYIWGDKMEEPFLLADQTPNPEPVAPQPGDFPGEDPHPGIDGLWQRVTIPQELAEETDYIIVSTKDNVPMGYTLVSGKALSRAEDVVEVSESGLISSIGDDVAIVRLVADGGLWKVEVFDQEGVSQGYLTSKASKNMSLSAVGTSIEIIPGEDQTLFDFGSAIGRLQYNASSPRFCTYTSNQQSVALYRKSASDIIETIEMQIEMPEQWFDLMGRPVDIEKAGPGIYIKSGRKVVVW